MALLAEFYFVTGFRSSRLTLRGILPRARPTTIGPSLPEAA